MPAACVCEPQSWGENVTPICSNYEADGDNDFCRHCEHDKACHYRPTPQEHHE